MVRQYDYVRGSDRPIMLWGQDFKNDLLNSKKRNIASDVSLWWREIPIERKDRTTQFEDAVTNF